MAKVARAAAGLKRDRFSDSSGAVAHPRGHARAAFLLVLFSQRAHLSRDSKARAARLRRSAALAMVAGASGVVFPVERVPLLRAQATAAFRFLETAHSPGCSRGVAES